MAANNTVKVAIVGDASSLEAAARKSNAALGGLETTAKKTGTGGLSAFKDLAAGAGLAFGTEQVLHYGQELYNTGLRLETLRAKSKVVFEGQIDDVKKWADENAAAMGLTTTELLGTAAAAADLLKPMGFTAAQAADMSKEMVGLSGALAAWSGGSRDAAEVSTILQKSLLGERDGLKELGISISEADVQTRLHATGQDKLKGAALEQAKAQTTLKLILEKSTDAQKAWNDGSMDSVKAANKAKASMSELKDSIAKGLMPVFREATSEIERNVVPALGELGKAITWTSGKMEGEMSGAAKDLAQVLMGNVTPGIRQVTKQWQYIDDIWKGRRLDSLALRTADWAEKLGLVADKAGDAADGSDDLTKSIEEQERVQENAERATKELTKALDDQKKKNDDLYTSFMTAWSGQNIDLPKAIDDVKTALLNYYDASDDATKATKEHGAASEEAQRAQLKFNEAGRGGYEAIQRVAQVALETEAARRGIAVDALTAAEKVSIQKQALEDLKLKVPEFTGAINEVASSMDGVANSMDTAAGKAEDAGRRISAAMQKMRDELVGIFNSIDIGNGLSLIVASADQLDRAASSATSAVGAIASYEKRNGPGWRS